MNRTILRRWLPLLLFALALAVTLALAHAHGVTVASALRWLYFTLRDAPWLVLVLFTLRPPFVLPISWLVLLCGMLWGLLLGGACAVVGMLLSAASSYAAARFLLPPQSAEGATTGKLGAWLTRLRREGFMSVTLMRLMLLPFDLVNFAAAGLRVDFRSFLLATALGNTVATAIYAGVGASIHVEAFLDSGHLPALREVLDTRQLLLTLAALAASLLLAHGFKRRSGST